LSDALKLPRVTAQRPLNDIVTILGAQWGDEGKGKLTQLLAKLYGLELGLVTRFGGGNNAGHTVVENGVKHALHAVPCGILQPGVMNLIGNGCVVNLAALRDELAALKAQGIDWEGRLRISPRAHVVFAIHAALDGLQEEHRKLGTTLRGIGPAYGMKARRTGVRVGALRDMDVFRRLMRESFEMSGWRDEVQKVEEYASWLLPMIDDDDNLPSLVRASGKILMNEGANAVMLDLDHGTYPYVTSSTTTIGGVCSGLGLAAAEVGRGSVIGVAKAYATRVGGGPFLTELTDASCGGARVTGAPGADIGAHLQRVGVEVGTTTGRKRRCGWLDVQVLRYAHRLNGFTELNITKLDVMDELKEIRIAVAYKDANGRVLSPDVMPSLVETLNAKTHVVYETLPGWRASTRACRTFADLPRNAQAYLMRIEQLVGVPVCWVGVGPESDAMIHMPCGVRAAA
jgi:adenylosuccinate synthase